MTDPIDTAAEPLAPAWVAALIANATSGPWVAIYDQSEGNWTVGSAELVGVAYEKGDALLFCAARNIMPTLLTDLTAAREEVGKLRDNRDDLRKIVAAQDELVATQDAELVKLRADLTTMTAIALSNKRVTKSYAEDLERVASVAKALRITVAEMLSGKQHTPARTLVWESTLKYATEALATPAAQPQTDRATGGVVTSMPYLVGSAGCVFEPLPPVDPTVERISLPQPVSHPHYTGTYCIHGLHEQCKRTCKTCAAPCQCRAAGCPCASPSPPPLRMTPEEFMAYTCEPCGLNVAVAQEETHNRIFHGTPPSPLDVDRVKAEQIWTELETKPDHGIVPCQQPTFPGWCALPVSHEGDCMRASHPEDSCARCGGPNVPWCAPSPLWNQVMRGGDINGVDQHHGIACPTCFAVMAEKGGIADTWRLSAQRVHVPLQTVTPSGRTWNAETWMWDEPLDVTQALRESVKATRACGCTCVWPDPTCPCCWHNGAHPAPPTLSGDHANGGGEQ